MHREGVEDLVRDHGTGLLAFGRCWAVVDLRGQSELAEPRAERLHARRLDLDRPIADGVEQRRVRLAQRVQQARGEGARPGAVLADHERRGAVKRVPRLLEEPSDRRAEDRMRLWRGQKVAGASWAGFRSAVVAVPRLIEGAGHEPGERDRAVPADLGPYSPGQDLVLAHLLRIGERGPNKCRLECLALVVHRVRSYGAATGRRDVSAGAPGGPPAPRACGRPAGPGWGRRARPP